MTLPQVFDLFDHWLVYPPEHECMAIALRCYTSWKPGEKEISQEEKDAAHQRSLEERWTKGGYLNVKQMFEGSGSPFASIGPKPMAAAP